MKAAILKDTEGLLSVESMDPALPADDERVVVIYAGALNHRDVWITQGKYPGIKFPTILGSDGSGICDGKEVVIQPGFGWGANQAFQSDRVSYIRSSKKWYVCSVSQCAIPKRFS